MASDESGLPPGYRDDRRGDGTLADTLSLGPGVPAQVDGGAGAPEATAESAEQAQEGVNICQFFLMGKCHFGHRCRLSHSDPSLDDSGAASPDQDDTPDGEKMEKHKKKGKVNKAKTPEYTEEKELNKKPRMRTADDVISRILWDPTVDASAFVVGYMDRFLGVLERPFCDFNWDTNPCDCDYSAELALPRHRIQYFTYGGNRVWDRHSRTDRVFGSTGQSLAPPFGRKAEIKEMDTQVQEQQQACLKTKEEQPPAISGQGESETEDCIGTEDKHLVEELQQSRGACVAEAANRLKASTDQMSSCQKEEVTIKEKGEDETLVVWSESLDGNEGASSYLEALNIIKNPSARLEQREEKPGGRPPKKRPTHFITFRANTPAILSCFQQLQEEVTSLLPSSAPHWQATSRLHVNLCLLVLRSPAEVAAAGQILRQFAQLDRNPPVAVTFPVKLKHFNGKVLFLNPQPQLQLQQLNSNLLEAYRKEGWLHRHSYNPRYHLTLAKVVDKEGERIFDGVGDLKVGKGLNFGRLPVNTLHLCAIGSSRGDGFYGTLCTVTLR